MSGLKITIPLAFTDTTIPVLRDDPILFKGSLALLDYTHLASPLPSGELVHAATIPNIAHREFAETANISDSGFPASFIVSGGGLTGAKGKVERSTKGGLHGIPTQTVANISPGDGVQVNFPSRVRQYMLDNKANKFYISAWDRLTRPSVSTTEDTVFYEIGSGSNSSQLAVFRQQLGWYTPAGGNVTGLYLPPSGTNLRVPGNYRRTIATQVPASYSSNVPANMGPQWGHANGTYNNAVPGWLGKSHSFINYRFYVEDLTVSGRSYDQVEAIDSALFTKEVLTIGGRYYGDTFTDPATIP